MYVSVARHYVMTVDVVTMVLIDLVELDSATGKKIEQADWIEKGLQKEVVGDAAAAEVSVRFELAVRAALALFVMAEILTHILLLIQIGTVPVGECAMVAAVVETDGHLKVSEKED